MTTPDAGLVGFPAPGLPTGSAGDLAHADLVGRLAREIYGQGQAASAPFQPHLPQTPQVPRAWRAFPPVPGSPRCPAPP